MLRKIEGNRPGLELVTVLSSHPWEHYEDHNTHFPPQEQLTYDNEIVGIISSPDENYFNVIMKDDRRSNFDFKQKKAVEKRFDQDQIHKIFLGYYSNHVLRGIEMVDRQGKVIYRSERDVESSHSKVEIELRDGQRLVGICGRSFNDSHPAAFHDLRFVIASYE